jgi:hypothetical protein
MSVPDLKLELESANDNCAPPRSTGSPAKNEIADESALRDHAIALGAARWLTLAASPTFAIMALLTGVPGGGPAMQRASSLRGMVMMYTLMTIFNFVPWLELLFQSTKRKRSQPGQ